MKARMLNIPGLGFDIVVVGESEGTNKVIAEMLEKKIAKEIAEDEEPQGCRHCGNVDQACACKGGL